MRDLIKLTNQQIVDKFEEIDAFPCMSEEYGYDVTFTMDTLNAFNEGCQSYKEYEKLEKADGFTIVMGAQVKKGDQRRDVYIIDFGKVRGIFQ